MNIDPYHSSIRDKLVTNVKVQVGRDPGNMETYKYLEVCINCIGDVKRALRTEK